MRQSQDADYADTPIYWFVLLQGAVERGDLEAAAIAQRELRRLGIEVRPTIAKRTRKEVPA